MTREELAPMLYQRAQAALAGDGWNVELEDVPAPWIRLHFCHELSASYTLTLTSEQDALARLESELAHPEFQIIASAPRDIPHASLMRLLRQRSGMYEWLPTVLGEVAATLAVLRLLTEAEADWLATAGVPWNSTG